MEYIAKNIHLKKALAQDAEKVKILSHFTSVMYAGGPLETSTGDMLVKAGKSLYLHQDLS